MFGLEKDKSSKSGKKKKDEFVFDLENDLKDIKRQREVLQQIQDRVQQIKVILRGGEEKQDFNNLGVLLHGYLSLIKVMGRLKR